VERSAPLDPLTAPDGERVLTTRRAAHVASVGLYQRAGSRMGRGGRRGRGRTPRSGATHCALENVVGRGG
jgi:hypothetical protein